MIPEAAVEAAAKCSYERELGVGWDNLRPSVQRGYLDDARAALEAAAPHMLAEAWEEGRQADDFSVSIGFEKNPYRSAL